MHTINDAAKMIGETYSRVWHAYAYGRVPAPLRVGRAFVLTDTDIVRLRAYFGGHRRRGASNEPSRTGHGNRDKHSSQQDQHDVGSCT
jgi:hypothetical protein